MENSDSESTPLLNTPLKLFLLAMILANIAGNMHFPLFSLYLQSLGANIGQVGWYFTLAAIAPLILQILGGWLSDSFGRLRAIAIGSIAGLVGYVVFVVAPTWQWVLIASVANSLTFALVAPSFRAFVAEQSSEETRGRVFGIMSSLYAIVGVLGPPIGGYVSEHYGFQILYIVSGALYGIAAVMRIWMARKYKHEPAPSAEKPSLKGLRTDLMTVGGMLIAGGVVTWLFLSDGLRDIAFNMEEQFRPLYLHNLMGITNTQIGLLQATASLVIMAVTGLGGWFSDKRGERVAIVLGYAVMACGQFVFLVSRTFPAFLLTWILYGLGWSLLTPAYDSLISKAVPDRIRGTAFGLFSTSTSFISLPAPLIGSLLWENFGPRTPFMVLPVVIVLMLPLLWLKLKLDPMRAEPEVGMAAAS